MIHNYQSHLSKHLGQVGVDSGLKTTLLDRLSNKSGLGEMQFMSIEELLMRCEQNMRGLDDEIRQKMNGQQNRNKNLGKMADINATIAKLETGKEHTHQGVANDAQAAVRKIDDLLKDTSLTPDQVEGLKNMRMQLVSNGDGTDTPDGTITENELQSIKDSASGIMDSFRNANETEMISIQSLVSKRSQLLQMTSNIVNAINEANKGLINNIR